MFFRRLHFKSDEQHDPRTVQAVAEEINLNIELLYLTKLFFGELRGSLLDL